MAAYAYFRLPLADSYTAVIQTDGTPEHIGGYGALNGRRGFVVAPFDISDDCPLLLIRPDRVEQRAVPDEPPHDEDTARADASAARYASDITSPDSDYAADFARCHAKLSSGEFSKIVLARSADVTTDNDHRPERLFLRACRMFPRTCVMLVSTPESGTWLAATPEILIESDGDSTANIWRTMALAGTMRLEAGQLGFDTPPSAAGNEGPTDIRWSTKNIEEQRYVATYIAESLKPFTTDIRETGPRTARAGNVVHLRSDFTFGLSDDRHIGDVITALHPTPAVCGLPKAETLRHIVTCEHTDRRYYSGFMGPLALDCGTHLYVSLRCMHIIDGRHFRLYAGGGLLRDSELTQEWHETEAKMESMRRCIGAGQTII